MLKSFNFLTTETTKNICAIKSCQDTTKMMLSIRNQIKSKKIGPLSPKNGLKRISICAIQSKTTFQSQKVIH